MLSTNKNPGAGHSGTGIRGTIVSQLLYIRRDRHPHRAQPNLQSIVLLRAERPGNSKRYGGSTWWRLLMGCDDEAGLSQCAAGNQSVDEERGRTGLHSGGSEAQRYLQERGSLL